jgi:ABC-2 type transport system permease protein
MHKALVIAAREYRAAVRTKAFLVSLVLMPVLMCGGIVVQLAMKKLNDKKEQRYAIVDRTPGQWLAAFLTKAAAQRNKNLTDPETGEQTKKPFAITTIEPSGNSPEAEAQQRFDLSQRVQQGEFSGFIEIGSDVYSYRKAETAAAPPGPTEDRTSIRYQSNKPNDQQFARWADRVINEGIQQHRFADSGISRAEVQAVQQPALMRMKGLSKKDPKTGAIEDASDESQIANILMPILLIILMFMMVVVAATPAMQGVVEEKTQRIAEVLLGSVHPFDLMLGKLIGLVGVSLTVAALYLIGIYVVASRYGFTEFLSPTILAWFVLFQVLALVMYGSVFIAIGAAANNMKDTQTMLIPVMAFAALPMMMLGTVIEDPNGKLATAVSLFPPSTPMMMVGRMSMPPGVPLWQPILGVVLVLATSLGCVYAAGRIFRVGILMQGKGAKIGDMIKWVVSG